jgi:hypothetical protein
LDFPKFLYLGQGAEIRREVLLYRADGSPTQRIDFFRRSYGKEYWDIIELKDPRKPFAVGEAKLHPSLSADVEKAISQALDYREFIDESVEVRSQLIRKGLMVRRPQIIVIVGRHQGKLDPEKLQVLYDRVRSRGAIEALTYEDIYNFAVQHCQSNRVLITTAVFRPNPALGLSQRILQLLHHYYETGGFYSLEYFASRDSIQRERDHKELVDAGLIIFHTYYDNGQWTMDNGATKSRSWVVTS